MIIVKLKPEISEVWKLSGLSLLGTLKKILFDFYNFCRFAHW
jgi:hypothetical protein